MAERPTENAVVDFLDYDDKLNEFLSLLTPQQTSLF